MIYNILLMLSMVYGAYNGVQESLLSIVPYNHGHDIVRRIIGHTLSLIQREFYLFLN